MMWHKPVWDNLHARHSSGQLAHALLFTSFAGCGLETFTWQVAAALLCHQQERSHFESCGSCQSCCLLKENHHPDVYHLQPLEDSTTIKIDAVRNIQEHILRTAQIGTQKIVVIEYAENLTQGASACLLKCLEEPPAHTFFLLMNVQQGAIENTLKSRCLRLPLPKPTPKQTHIWLQTQGIQHEEIAPLLEIFDYAPIAAQAAMEDPGQDFFNTFIEDCGHVLSGTLDPCQVAEKYEKQEMETLFLGLFTTIKQLAKKVPNVMTYEELLRMWQILLEKRKNWLKVATINKRLLVESVLIAWQTDTSR